MHEIEAVLLTTLTLVAVKVEVLEIDPERCSPGNWGLSHTLEKKELFLRKSIRHPLSKH